MKINIERLMDIIANEYDTYNEYRYKSANLYSGGSLEELKKREAALKESYTYSQRADDAIWAVVDVLNIDRGRLYIAYRATLNWRRRTKFQRLIPEKMARQLEEFIFGVPAAPSYV